MKINLQTLTPLHIGNGEEMQGDFESLYFREECCSVVIDEKKVLGILGEENLPQWIACIEKKESLLALLRQRRPGLLPGEVARRILPVQGGGGPGSKSVREQLHSGNGSPLLPGSSLKGALRTVVWAASIFERKDMVKQSANLGVSRYDRRTGREKFRFSDAVLAKKIFGTDPNHDVFRLLQVGDAMFDSTACFKTEVVNLGREDWEIKDSITQWVEAIPVGATAHSRLVFNELLAKKGGRLFNGNEKKLRPDQLFPLINEHTLRLLNDEISYWRDDQSSPMVLGNYIEEMESIRSQTEACPPGQCVLRLGWGTGFRNMTGDWHSLIEEEDFDRLVQALRPKHDVYITFPKTTRMVAEGTPMGYIKLTI